ncbi:CST complex subunit Ten1 [Pyronema omphalodes]|nr:CST complex subunit Ten1 [Pyronema omphalodes]
MSVIIPLQDIASQPKGQKVRFLSCLFAYEISTSTMILHEFPALTRFVEVDATAVLSTLDMGSLVKGGWWNVVGYIEQHSTLDCGSNDTQGNGSIMHDAGFTSTAAKENNKSQEVIARVRAVMVWPAEGMSVSTYTRTIQEMKKLQEEMDEAVALSLGNLPPS